MTSIVETRPRLHSLRGFLILGVAWLSLFTNSAKSSDTVTTDPETQALPWHQVIEAAGQIDFANDIVPILTKSGCNAGVCHAKAGGGQNGFELSLLGFEPDYDYQQIVMHGRGRRLFPAVPERSLLIRKAVGTEPHRGGVRINVDSPEYRLLIDWIKRGSPEKPTSSDPQVVRTHSTISTVRVLPESRLMQPGETQQLSVVATYSDGSTRDVTSLALFESNNSALATVNDQGLVTVADLPGTAAIMVRYSGFVSVFRPAVPLGAPLATIPPSTNLVDQHVFANLQRLGIPPSSSCDDETFQRRVTIDLTGRLPSEADRELYATWPSDQRRTLLVDHLLQQSDYAEYFANKWTSLLKNRRDDTNDLAANFSFHAWVRDSLQAGTPYDQMVKELLGATGTIASNPAVAWYKRVKDPKEQLEDISQLFLGVRLQCAQCHHHPFERWSQDDYYSLAAFFSRVGRKPTGVQNEDMIFHQRGVAETRNVRSGQMLRPRALGTDLGEIQPSEDPRLKLADWMRSPDNPFFARSLVNRYWKHFFHVGLIEPEDDIRDTNPPSNPELLEALEKNFIASGFDLRALAKTIVTSQTYQLSSQPNSQNKIDSQNFSRFYPRRLTAEVLLDSIDQLTGSQTNFANLPAGTRAIALPDNSYNRAVPFLKVFGRPENSSVCECERVQSANLAQSLHLLNAADLKGKLATAGGLADQLAKSTDPLPVRIARIYQTAFCRAPTETEQQVITESMTAGSPTKQDFEDILWAIINSKEFLFNH